MRIVIVEDEDKYFEQLNTFIEQIQKEADFDNDSLEITRFKSGEEFLSSFVPNSYDLLFADIGLPDMDGMSMCTKVRELDEKIVISFITSLSQYAIQGYTVNAVDYILKPIQYDPFKIKFLRIYKIAYKNVLEHKKYTFYDKDRRTYVVSKNDIAFIEVSGHKLTFYTTKGIFNEFKPLSLYEKELVTSNQSNTFMKCNNCYLVNLNYIDRYTKDFVYLMINNKEYGLIISRNRRKPFIDALKNRMIKKVKDGE